MITRPLLTADEMRACETQAIRDWGIFSLILQEHAAIGALALMPHGEPIHVLAGPGNNGGDALALARLAVLQGRQVDVWTLTHGQPQQAPQSQQSPQSPQWKGDAAVQARLWEGLGKGYRQTDAPWREVSSWRGWVVDGLFGLGIRLPLRADALSWANALGVSERRFKVLALDLPTGLDPSSGDVTGPVIRADVTACFGHLKRCHGLRPAKDMCGEVFLVPIPLNANPSGALSVLCEPEFAKPKWNAHKYEHGHIAIRAGTRGMSGAAVLAVSGALRGGAGLVTVLPDADAADIIAAQIPEAMVVPWEGALPRNIDVLLAGPGGVEDVPDWDGPLVLDASALRAGDGPKWLVRPQTILTPHSGEFSRLFGQEPPVCTQERLEAVESLNNELNELMGESAGKPSGVLVLKGAQTLITGGGSRHVYVNPTGHPGLATGGAGDFLAGLLAARYARNLNDPLTAALDAVWLHGAAADRLGQGPLVVSDLGLAASQILRDLYGQSLGKQNKNA